MHGSSHCKDSPFAFVAVGDLLGDVFLDLKQPESARKLRETLDTLRADLKSAEMSGGSISGTRGG